MRTNHWQHFIRLSIRSTFPSSPTYCTSSALYLLSPYLVPPLPICLCHLNFCGNCLWICCNCPAPLSFPCALEGTPDCAGLSIWSGLVTLLLPNRLLQVCQAELSVVSPLLLLLLLLHSCCLDAHSFGCRFTAKSLTDQFLFSFFKRRRKAIEST